MRRALARAIGLMLFIGRRMRAIVVFGRFEYDGPAGWKDGLVDIQVIGFEGEPSKDWRDCESLAVGQVDQTLRRSHDDIQLTAYRMEKYASRSA